MTNNEPTPKKKKRKINYSRVLPVLIGLLIIIIAVIGIVQLVRWNRGQEFIIDETVNVDTEPEDFVFFMDPSTFAGEHYDGNFDILILGNDTAAYDIGGTNIGELIAEQTNATLYNCALPGSFMCTQTERETIMERPIDAFSFFWISCGINLDNWTLQEEALAQLPDSYDKARYREVLDQLKAIDYNTIDLLIVYYDGHDYLAKHPINNFDNIYDVQTIEGNFTGSYESYQVKFPYMQHMLISPTFCYVTHEDGTREGCDTANLGYGNLPTCMTTLQVQSQNYSVSYIDNFGGLNITPETADSFLLEDGITPNEEGREKIAARISGFINARLK